MTFPHTLYFIRHGETDWNRAGRLQGQTETDLNALGRAQAARNGEALSELLRHRDIAADALTFVSSPMKRTRQTAEIVREKLGLTANGYAFDDRLREVGFGTYEGLTPADIKVRFPDQHRARKDDRWSFTPPGGESYRQFSGRVGAWLATVDRDMIVIAHGGTSRVLRGHLLNLAPKDLVALEVPQDKVMILGDGRCDWV